MASSPCSASAAASSLAPVPPPPVLHFDDGSRALLVMRAATTAAAATATDERRDNDNGSPDDIDDDVDRRMEDRYELDRVVREIRNACRERQQRRQRRRRRRQRLGRAGWVANDEDDDDQLGPVVAVMVGVALQFPESWVSDAPLVCRELERRWQKLEDEENEKELVAGHNKDGKDECKESAPDPPPPSLAAADQLFAFCVGDSNDDDCCPDVDGAQHLPGTHFLVQFGPNACLPSSTSSSLSRRGSKGRQQQSCCRSDEVPAKPEATCCGAGGSTDHTDPDEDLGSDDDEDTGLRVLRAFGRRDLPVADCVGSVRSALTSHKKKHSLPPRRYVVLYDVRYRHDVDELQTVLSESMDALVVLGRVRVDGDDGDDDDLDNHPLQELGGAIVAGGIELPSHLVDWASYTLLYVGDPASLQFLHISLRLQGTGIDHVLACDPSSFGKSNDVAPPQPATEPVRTHVPMSITTGWSPRMSRFLKRRYYLVQKAKSATTVGIVVAANVGGVRDEDSCGSPVRRVVDALMRMLVDHGRSPYLYSVGRSVTVAKLSNFADLVETFVYVACPYGTLRTLQELDGHISVPIVTPMEMATALGRVEWNHCRRRSVNHGTSSSTEPSPLHLGYSVDWDDFLEVASESTPSPEASRPPISVLDDQDRESEVAEHHKGASYSNEDDDDDDDAPYFSLVTGRYESRTVMKVTRAAADVDLTLLPGHGVLTRHASSAAEALKRREYQGLRLEIGETDVRAAIPGQKGIASDYGDR